MKVLVVGGGAREHALAWCLDRSPLVAELLVAPGNAGIAALARCMPVPAEDAAGLVDLVVRESVDLTVVGPEAPLVAGIADELTSRGRLVFGPSRAAAEIEGSKAFAKSVMQRAGVPTARAGVFTEVAPALRYVEDLGGRAVVKADGLAAGKGVTVAADRETAARALDDALVRGAFGSAGSSVLVEELLEGPEVSAFALCDGETVVPLALSQDFKRAGEGDTGPNTGGMGAYSPLAGVDEAVAANIWELLRRTAEAMAEAGTPYRGLLYGGLMMTAGGPMVLEFNCRFGDPETEAVLPRLRTDLAEVLLACAEGRLAGSKVDLSDEASVTVVVASGGYPGSYRTGFPVDGVDVAGRVDGATVFHAGTTERDGRVVTAGGRVLAVSAVGSSLSAARRQAYAACERLAFEGMWYRRDIAARAAEGESS
jgi:phosphoribosylamine--glycine ligase